MASRNSIVGLVVAAASYLVGCSLVVPLDDEYTFGDGGTCDTTPTQEMVCADKCGEVVACGMTFTCGGCVGELSCGVTSHVCECTTSPCAIASLTEGDLSVQRLVDVAVDAQGNVFFAGNFRGTVTFGDDTYTNLGATREDIFLVKLGPAGNVLWSRAYGALASDPANDGTQLARAIAVDGAGNVVLVGHSYGPTNLGGSDLTGDTGNMIIVKLDPNGNHVFSAEYGTEFSIDANAVAINPGTQDILVAGKFWGSLKFGSLTTMTAAGIDSYFDTFLVRFSPDGTPAYSKRFGDGAEQVPDAIAANGSSVFLGVHFTGTFDFGAPNTTSLTTTSFYALALTKLASTSTFPHAWSRQYGTDVADVRLAAGSAGNVFVAGSFGGTLDITTPALVDTAGTTFLASIDTDGNTTWAHQYANASISKLATGADGSVYVVGTVSGDVDFGGGSVVGSGSSDPFVAHFAANGDHLFSRVFSAPVGNQSATSVDAAADGTIWMGAEYQGEIDFGLGTVVTEGLHDVAVVGYRP